MDLEGPLRGQRERERKNENKRQKEECKRKQVRQ